MKIRLVLFITVVFCFSTSCETHHDQEKIVKDLILNHGRIEETMRQYESSKFYMDSVLKSANPDTIWSVIFSEFDDNYSIDYDGLWMNKRYYEEYYDVDGSKSSCISISNLSGEGESLEFHFKNRSNSWRLIGIKYVPQIDIN